MGISKDNFSTFMEQVTWRSCMGKERSRGKDFMIPIPRSCFSMPRSLNLTGYFTLDLTQVLRIIISASWWPRCSIKKQSSWLRREEVKKERLRKLCGYPQSAYAGHDKCCSLNKRQIPTAAGASYAPTSFGCVSDDGDNHNVRDR